MKKIFEYFGYISTKDHKKIVEILDNEKLKLKAEVAALKTDGVPRVDIFLADPTPIDTEARKVYVATVAGFFKDIMEPKLNQMLSNLHNILEERDSDRDYDLVLKGVAYAFREMMRWGQAMTNEQIANQNTGTDKEDSDLENIKEKLKET